MPYIPKFKIDKTFKDSSQKEWIIFANSLGCDLSMWDLQVEKLLPQLNILRFDNRGLSGYGGSMDYPAPFTIADLAGDVIALMDELNIAKANFVGISMGGLITQHLAINHSERFSKIVISNSGAKLGTAETWRDREVALIKVGVKSLIAGIIPRWFTANFCKTQPEKVAKFINMLNNCDNQGYLENCRAISCADYREELTKINIPTLIIGSTYDGSTPLELSKFMFEKISLNAKTKFVELPCAHISCVECADDFSQLLIDFINN